MAHLRHFKLISTYSLCNLDTYWLLTEAQEIVHVFPMDLKEHKPNSKKSNYLFTIKYTSFAPSVFKSLDCVENKHHVFFFFPSHLKDSSAFKQNIRVCHTWHSLPLSCWSHTVLPPVKIYGNKEALTMYCKLITYHHLWKYCLLKIKHKRILSWAMKRHLQPITDKWLSECEVLSSSTVSQAHGFSLGRLLPTQACSGERLSDVHHGRMCKKPAECSL